MAAMQATMALRLGLLALFRGSSQLLRDFGFVEAQPAIISLMLFFMVSAPIDTLVAWLVNVRRIPCALPCKRCCACVANIPGSDPDWA